VRGTACNADVLDLWFPPNPVRRADRTVVLVSILTQSRWGYQNISVMEDVVRGYKDADIPLEVSCDLLERIGS
jgi:hypothetical protein